MLISKTTQAASAAALSGISNLITIFISLYSQILTYPRIIAFLRIILSIGVPLSVRKIAGTRVLVPGHQNSGAPTYFFQVFSSLHAHSCWPCSDKTRFCVEHINTLGKQEKFKTLKPILEIKTKNCWSAWKGTRLLVPRHQTSGAQAPDFWCPGTKTLVPPTLFGVFSHQCMLISCWQCSNITRFRVKHMKTLGKQDKFIFLMPSLEIKTKNYCSAWKGTKILVPGHQNSGAPAFFERIFWSMHAHFMLAMF